MAIQRIERKEYLDKLIAFRDKKIIKVVTGVRRCGKSTIMEIYQDYLREQGVTGEQIIAINLEDYDFYELRDPKKLHIYVKERLKENIMTYVFLDEIQHCEDFAGVIDSLHIKKNVDLYITGSNAYMLSSCLLYTSIHGVNTGLAVEFSCPVIAEHSSSEASQAGHPGPHGSISHTL